MITPKQSVRNMRPYSPPTQGRGGKVRLDFNENTVGCSPRVLAAVTQALTDENVAMYPEYSEARTEIAKFLGVDDDQLTFTNGTDEAIQLLVNTFFESGDELVILSPSYAMYRFYAEVAGVQVTEVAYRIEDELVFPLQSLTKMITNATRGVFIANPNNPTGGAISVNDIITILEHSPQTIVLIDEAYVEFSQISVLPLLNRYPNLFVSRTFSKAYGMAGLRCGCLVSSASNIAWARRAQSPYSVNAVAITAARAAVGDIEFVANYVREVVNARQMVQDALTRLGLRWFLSDGNFLLFDAGARKQQILDQMKSADILIRDRSHEIDGCVRVTIGTIDQMKLFITEMEKVI
jgi:histidinol-phosphate aminotransferase